MNAEETAMVEMPRYKSHKTVWALKIASITVVGETTDTSESSIVRLEFESSCYAPRRVCLRGKPTPEVGWYLVQYEGDYFSFSPPEQFEKGNTLEVSDLPGDSTVENFQSFHNETLSNWFTYHSPTLAQLDHYAAIRGGAFDFALIIDAHVPAGADKTAALRKLRETMMAANAAIACHVAPSAAVQGFNSALAQLEALATASPAPSKTGPA